MKKIDLFYGIIIGIITSFIGSYLFIEAFTPYSFFGGLQILKFEGKLGKIISLARHIKFGFVLWIIKI